MRFLFVNHLQNAYDSLRSNKTRTVLTITGVTIGVASIVAVLSLGAGASRIIGEQVEELGGNIAVVRPTTSEGSSIEDIANRQPHNAFTASTLTEADTVRIAEEEFVDQVAPLMLLSGTITGDTETTSATTVATTPSLASISNLEISEGQMFSAETEETTAVIGRQLAIDIYGTEAAIGKTFSFRNESFRVIGVLDRQDNPINYNGVDFDNAALISIQSGRLLNEQALQIQQINVKTDSVDNLQPMIENIRTVLADEHGSESDFAILSGDDVADPSNQVFYAIAGMFTAIAAISLVVGGIGIMNIMLVNVAERTREIGIRKAIGATHNDIIWQFLIESIAMGLAGGVAGTAAGFGVAFLISLFLTFNPVITPTIILTALGTAVIVGVLFGLYPAVRAASKQPVESLRQYH